MKRPKISLKKAVEFHGHLGPYLVLGVLAGEFALEKLNIQKYFGLKIKVKGVDKKPKSCFIDGLQLSTGATYGKGNIFKLNGSKIAAYFSDRRSPKLVTLTFRDNLIRSLKEAKSHQECEKLAKRLYTADPRKLFRIKRRNLRV